MAKSAFKKTAGQMAHKIVEKIDIKEWTQEHPFESTGTAALVGFIVAAKFNASPSEKIVSPPISEVSSETKISSKKILTDLVGSVLHSVIFPAGVNILKEVLTPLVTQHLPPKSESSQNTSS
jgi:hypothetical protein